MENILACNLAFCDQKTGVFSSKILISIVSPCQCTRSCVAHGRRTYDRRAGIHFEWEHWEVSQCLALRLRLALCSSQGPKLTLLRKWRFWLTTGRLQQDPGISQDPRFFINLTPVFSKVESQDFSGIPKVSKRLFPDAFNPFQLTF